MASARWQAAIVYTDQSARESGLYIVDKDFEEFSDLGEIIEAGPDWNTIERITITLLRRTP